MKSFCFKTNNIRILEYILKRIDEIDFENLIYSKNKFSIYENVIIHYFGNDNEAYYEFLSKLLEEIVIELTSSVSPCVIKGKNSNNAKYLVLPVRLVR